MTMASLGEVEGHWQMFECYTFPCSAFVYFNIHTTHCGGNTTLMTYSVLNFVDNLEINEVSMVFMNISKEDGYTHPITLPDKQPHYHNFIIPCQLCYDGIACLVKLAINYELMFPSI